MQNLFDNLPAFISMELVETLVQSPTIRIKWIVSTRQNRPEGFWYDQEVLKGETKLRFETEDQPGHINMKPGDHVLMPARKNY